MFVAGVSNQHLLLLNRMAVWTIRRAFINGMYVVLAFAHGVAFDHLVAHGRWCLPGVIGAWLWLMMWEMCILCWDRDEICYSSQSELTMQWNNGRCLDVSERFDQLSWWSWSSGLGRVVLVEGLLLAMGRE